MWQDLIICGNSQVAQYAHECGFNDIIILINNLITNLIVLSTFLAVAAFAYSGIKLLASGGNESAMKDAKSILSKVLIGYLWILAAWILVYTITTLLLRPDLPSLLEKP